MAVEVTKFLFGEIVEGEEGLLKGPFGSDLKKSLYVPKGPDTYKVYLQENILKKNNSAGDHYISKKYFDEKMSRYAVKEGDFIVTGDGTLGEIYQLKNITEVGIISSSLLRISLKKDIVDEDYFYYLFIAIIKKQLIVKSNNSVLKHLPGLGDIRKHEVYLPKLSVQRKVGSILSVLDKRIENLRAQNRVLEQTAKTIYDYTFLQCAGHQTTYNKTLNRNIPVGWEVKEFQNICNIKRGASPRPIDDYMDPTNQGMPWVKISDASKDGSPFMLDVKESIIKDGVSKSVTVTPGTLIVSNSASPGIPKFIQLTACVHDGWLVLDKYDESFKYYLFYVILDMRENLLHIASGSVFKNLKTDYLKQLPVLIPDSKTMENFNAKVKPLFEKQLVNAKQIESLTTQRNTLLPLLMTGQIEV